MNNIVTYLEVGKILNSLTAPAYSSEQTLLLCEKLPARV